MLEANGMDWRLSLSKGVLTSGMVVLPSKVAEKLEQRRQMRRARRYRKTSRRPKRFDNRHRAEGWIAKLDKIIKRDLG
jgi:uncharacterized protein YaiI (UPF0178 family)